jgi:hypothetical protein
MPESNARDRMCGWELKIWNRNLGGSKIYLGFKNPSVPPATTFIPPLTVVCFVPSFVVGYEPMEEEGGCTGGLYVSRGKIQSCLLGHGEEIGLGIAFVRAGAHKMEREVESESESESEVCYGLPWSGNETSPPGRQGCKMVTISKKMWSSLLRLLR